MNFILCLHTPEGHQQFTATNLTWKDQLTLLHSQRPKLYGVLAVLSAIGLTCIKCLTEAEHKLMMYRYTFLYFHHNYKEGQLFWLPICLTVRCSPSKMGITLTGKNLLLKKQILPLKIGPHCKRKQKWKLQSHFISKRKQSRTRSDCSFRSSQIWFYIVCSYLYVPILELHENI